MMTGKYAKVPCISAMHNCLASALRGIRQGPAWHYARHLCMAKYRSRLVMTCTVFSHLGPDSTDLREINSHSREEDDRERRFGLNGGRGVTGDPNPDWSTPINSIALSSRIGQLGLASIMQGSI